MQNLIMRNSSPNRQATRMEAEHAEMLLRSLSGSEVAASLVKLSVYLEPEDNPVLVTSDFEDIGYASILLVPPGTHHLSAAHLTSSVTHVVGLSSTPGSYPVLVLEGEDRNVIRIDSGTSFQQCVFETGIRFVNVALEAPRPTVVEVCFSGNGQFTDIFFNTWWGENVDALNPVTQTFMNGRDWALATYGDEYRGRSGLEKSLGSFHQGMMNTIDNTFRPLVRIGEKLDAFLGLK